MSKPDSYVPPHWMGWANDFAKAIAAYLKERPHQKNCPCQLCDTLDKWYAAY